MGDVVSTFSGAAGLDLGVLRALGPNGRLVSWCEINRDAQNVLRHHFPRAQGHDDITTHPTPERQPDWLIGGPPCQDLSPAGRREGAREGTRSGLIRAWADLVQRARPRHVVVEEVPEGLDVDQHGDCWADHVLPFLADLGYGVAWGVVDPRSQGVPQRRPRLFVLAALPSPGLAAAAIARCGRNGLADAACGIRPPGTADAPWTSPPGPADGSAARSVQRVADCLTAKERTCDAETFVPAAADCLTAGPPNARDETRIVATSSGPLCSTTGGPRTDNIEEPIIAVRTHRATSASDPDLWRDEDTHPTLNTFDDTGPARATALIVNVQGSAPNHSAPVSGLADALTTTHNEKGTHVVHRGVRRLTVVERERVMGWPDDWTRYGRTASGELVTISRTARHRLTGNGVVAPVAHAIVAHWLRHMAEAGA